MTTAERSERWATFIADFFRPPNQLRVGQGVSELDAFIAAAEQALTAEPPAPVVVPARTEGLTNYFGIAFDRDQARSLRDLLRSHIGTTWTDFDGRPVAGRSDLDSLDLAAIDLGQNPEFVFRFQVAASSRDAVRGAVQALVRALAARPPRDARIGRPIGRLLGDFADACAAGAEEAAREAYAHLADDHRITATNRLFLHAQLLASFERWADLEAAQGFGELVRLSRPALASDALARLALSRLPSPPDVASFESGVSHFGALIPSVGAIRSTAGARYYALWSLAAGESATTLGERMANAGWAEDPIVSHLLTDLRRSGVQAGLEVASDTDDEAIRELITKALDRGLFDAAVELLGRLPPLNTDLPVAVAAVRETLTPAAVALLERYRRSLGDRVVREAIGQDAKADTGVIAPVEVVLSLQERIEVLLGQTISPRDRALHAEAIQQTGLSEVLTPGGLEGVAAVIRAKTALPTDQIDVEGGLDVCIDLARDLKSSGSQPSGLRSLGLAIVELWAYHDRSGDRRRLRRIIQVVNDLIDVGVSASTYDDLVEFLRAGWDPFLTDVDLSAGLDTIELLIPFRPDGSHSLDAFARPVLARIGIHNARRLSSAALAVAIELAPEFGLGVILPEDETEEAEPPAEPIRAGTVLALYSLMEQAAERAATILRRRHPGLEVVTMADHVGTASLRAIASTADLVVVMDRAAKHAATDALRAARGQRPIRFASGKGSTSLIDAAEVGLRELSIADSP